MSSTSSGTTPTLTRRSPITAPTASITSMSGASRLTRRSAWESSTSHGREDPDPAASYPASSTEIAYNFGGGVKYPLSERFLARRSAPVPVDDSPDSGALRRLTFG